jgi:hypothetical protein
MAEIINNLKDKSLEELKEALHELSAEEQEKKAFIDINGNAFLIPKEVYDLINALATQVEKLKSEGNGI